MRANALYSCYLRTGNQISGALLPPCGGSGALHIPSHQKNKIYKSCLFQTHSLPLMCSVVLMSKENDAVTRKKKKKELSISSEHKMNRIFAGPRVKTSKTFTKREEREKDKTHQKIFKISRSSETKYN